MNPNYKGPLSIDFYGRLHPSHSVGTVRLREASGSRAQISTALAQSFDLKTDHTLLYRRLGVCANNVKDENGNFQLDLFTDYEALEKERRIQAALLEMRGRYGRNAIFTGKNMMRGATAIERNGQIGGHRA